MDKKTFRFADSFDATDRLRVNMNAPLPLGYMEAVRRAMQLREDHNLTWAVIAFIMAEYHGVQRSKAWWQATLREHGAVPRPRGNPLHGRRPSGGLALYLAGQVDGPGGHAT